MSSTLKTASVLAFERKLAPSDAVFHAGNWDDRAASASWPSVKLREKSVRGTISNRLKTKDQDPAKLDAAIENPNLQTVDVAALPADADTLKVQFTLRVLSGAGTPSACNSAEYQARLAQTVQTYASAQGFAELQPLCGQPGERALSVAQPRGRGKRAGAGGAAQGWQGRAGMVVRCAGPQPAHAGAA